MNVFSVFRAIATNGQICDAVHLAFERFGKGIAYFMLAAEQIFFRFKYFVKPATVLLHVDRNEQTKKKRGRNTLRSYYT